jgi:asparagine synthase (glutamine-hydrolysing)
VSAIAGIFFLDGRPVDRLVLERMVGSIAHRGPDGEGTWREGPVGLGHRMLWTTPESLHEELPLVRKSGDLVLTADVRLDNRDELIAALGIASRPRQEIGDGELILGAYERWGERCPEKLLGDFTFAIWDRQRQELFCARDHMGVKPFYYYRSDRVFVFASEIKALLCVPEVPRRLNEVRVADYLVLGFEDKSITFYGEIFRLPPAHRIVVGREVTTVRPYWTLDPTREVRFSSDEEYTEAFRELFTEAVRCRLRGAFPVGAELSGGLDSSAIVGVARKLLGNYSNTQLQTFSAVFEDISECDESQFIDAVLAEGGVEAHKVRGDRLSPLADLERVLWHEDEAFFSAGLYLGWAWRSTAHRHGVRILLSGEGGDSVVSHGIAYLTELVRKGRWRAFAVETAKLSRLRLYSPWGYVLNHGLKPLAPQPLRLGWRMLRGHNRLRWWTANTIINPEFARRTSLLERRQVLGQKWSEPVRSLREDHWRDLTSGIYPFSLEVADKVSAAFSIETRYPFWDRRLVEFCLALPPEQKLRGGWTRLIMRQALVGIYPEEIRWRTDKADNWPNSIRNLLMLEREVLDEIILKNPQVIEEYIDVASLRETYHRFVSKGIPSDAFAVWRAVTLALWLRQTGLSP